jgi:hypothetical protein
VDNHSTTPNIDDLDRPRTIKELAKWLRDRGEVVTPAQLYRWARDDLLPVAKCGRVTSTGRAYFVARAPKAVAR